MTKQHYSVIFYFRFLFCFVTIQEFQMKNYYFYFYEMKQTIRFIFITDPHVQ